MEDQAVAPEATEAAPEVAPEQAPAQEANNEQDVNNEAGEAVEPASEEAPTEEEQSPFQEVKQEPITPFTTEDLKVDDAGNIDVNALLQQFNDKISQAQQGAVNQSMSQVEARDKYKEEWQKAEEKYPEIKTDKNLREWIYARHVDATERTKKWVSPTKAADEFFKLTKAAETRGIETAQTNTEVQKSAALESTSNSGQSQSTTDSDLQAKLNSSDPEVARAARRAILTQRIKAGRI